MPRATCAVPNCDRLAYAHGLCRRDYDLHRVHPDETPEQLAERRRRARTADEVRALIQQRVTITSTGCWEWQGSKLPGGYGGIRWNGKHWRVHRLAYELFRGGLQPEVEVCHRCDNPPCCNPAHMFLGAHQVNMRDAARKRRMDGNGGRTGEANGRARLTENGVRAIRASTLPQTELARTYGVRQPTISAIKLRKIWTHVA